MKVLIVDDSQHALAIAKARLAREKLEIVCAHSGQAGLEAARRERPDLILLDVDMPGMSGFDVCRQLKGDIDLGMIPVIFLTASSSTEDRVKGLDLGAVDYVTKPFDVFELRARVRAALRTKRLQDMLMKYANVDPLTELPNRRALMERLGQEWQRIRRHGGSLAFIMADIDLFKRINDTYGHQLGDRLLHQIARVIADQCRESDFPARYGGEEFAVLVPAENARGASGLAERCRREVEAISMEVGKETARVTASFGVADSEELPSPEDLIRLADEALYAAKRAGRNRVQCACDVPLSCQNAE